MSKILIGLPTYDNRTDARQALFLYSARVDNLQTVVQTKQLSALCWCFNWFWANVLNDKTIDYFLLMHADIIPIAPIKWISKLIAEAENAHADLFSVLSPIKNEDGLTSTALVSAEHPHERRLTMTEAMQLPQTFDAGDVAKAFGWQSDSAVRLMVNTGLMLVDLRRNRDKWETMWFKTVDRVEKQGGKFVATFTPEDWDFSRQAHANGLRVAATRAVTLLHHGAADYRNDQAWGTKAADG